MFAPPPAPPAPGVPGAPPAPGVPAPNAISQALAAHKAAVQLKKKEEEKRKEAGIVLLPKTVSDELLRAVPDIAGIVDVYGKTQAVLDDAEKPLAQKCEQLKASKVKLLKYKEGILSKLSELEESCKQVDKNLNILILREQAVSLNKKELEGKFVSDEVLARLPVQAQAKESLEAARKMAVESRDVFYTEAKKELKNIHGAIATIDGFIFEESLTDLSLTERKNAIDLKQKALASPSAENLEALKTISRKADDCEVSCKRISDECMSCKKSVNMFMSLAKAFDNPPEDLLTAVVQLKETLAQYFSIRHIEERNDARHTQRTLALNQECLDAEKDFWLKKLAWLRKNAVINPAKADLPKKHTLICMSEEDYHKMEESQKWNRLPIAIRGNNQTYQIAMNIDKNIKVVQVVEDDVKQELEDLFERPNAADGNFRERVLVGAANQQEDKKRFLEANSETLAWILRQRHNFEAVGGGVQKKLPEKQISLLNNPDYYVLSGPTKYTLKEIEKLRVALGVQYSDTFLEEITMELSRALVTLRGEPGNWMPGQMIKGQYPGDFLEATLGFDVRTEFKNRKKERLMPDLLPLDQQAVLNNEDYYNLKGNSKYSWEEVKKIAVALGIATNELDLEKVQNELERFFKTEDGDADNWTAKQLIKDQHPRDFLKGVLGIDVVDAFKSRVAKPLVKPKEQDNVQGAGGGGAVTQEILLKYEADLTAQRAKAEDEQKKRIEAEEKLKEVDAGRGGGRVLTRAEALAALRKKL